MKRRCGTRLRCCGVDLAPTSPFALRIAPKLRLEAGRMGLGVGWLDELTWSQSYIGATCHSGPERRDEEMLLKRVAPAGASTSKRAVEA